MDKVYSPQSIEQRLYQWWETNQYFAPKGNGPAFSMVIPPPNVTGRLHMGHALNHTLQDIICRWKRLSGYRVLWVPGTDHAGIATQNVVEKQLASQNKSRHDLGREPFIKEIWNWKAEYGSIITNQIRRLGDSVDWSKESFTMDPERAKAVRHHFVSMYNDGLIYKGKYIINWCPRCHTALSDVEVEHHEKTGHLWDIKYKSSCSNQYIIVATTRPETLFGDRAIAVHPDDERYQALIGTTVTIPLSNEQIPVIADAHVDPQFGTGAVKVTPAHDANDFEIGQRHNLEPLLIMTESGEMNDNVPATYIGLDRYACRKQVIQDLNNHGLLHHTHDHQLSQGTCYRCQTVVEPYLSKQWFVNMKKLAQPAIDAVKNGSITFTPPRWEKLYFDWMENIRDWCISRQIWWGHRIPVWYDPKDPDTPIVCLDDPDDPSLIQDNDVLDTWFSSALWPFSTMGWPNESNTDFQTFYPTSLLVTGYDIVTFWVSRMITMGLHETNQAPFSDVYIHGLVRDSTGKKMSKSLGNAIDPIELIDEYGADALRFCLAAQSTLGGQDIKFSIEKVQSCRNFANKVWNATRFILGSRTESSEPIHLDLSHPPTDTTPADQWIISQFYMTLADINQQFKTYNYAQATEILWEFIWNTYCDWYVEITKSHKLESMPVLLWILTQSLLLLHPFMPFITEEIWQKLQESGITLPETSIMNASWPTEQPDHINRTLTTEFQLVTHLIREIRNLRQQVDIPPSKHASIHISAPTQKTNQLNQYQDIINRLCNVTISESSQSDNTVSSVVDDVTIELPLDGLIDIEKEKKRINSQLTKLNDALSRVNSKLSNDGFLSQAPEPVISKIKQQHVEFTNEKTLLEEQLAQLS